MSEKILALNGLSTDIFAGVPVKDYETSIKWYEKLFGCPPSFFPNDVEAVWQVAEHQWMYIIVDSARAGHSIQNLMVTELNNLIDQVAERGITYSKEELPADNTRKVMYYDPDGNEVGFISVTA